MHLLWVKWGEPKQPSSETKHPWNNYLHESQQLNPEERVLVSFYTVFLMGWQKDISKAKDKASKRQHLPYYATMWDTKKWLATPKVNTE